MTPPFGRSLGESDNHIAQQIGKGAIRDVNLLD
jgi:hypothetical protein